LTARTRAIPERLLRPVRARVARRILRLALLSAGAAQHATAVPSLARTVDVETPFGGLWVQERDAVFSRYVAAHGIWEAGETANLAELLAPGMTFLDVGAHVGYFTLLAARHVGPLGLVVAFEPEPRNFELLLANVWRHGLSNVLCMPWAVGDANGFTELHLSPDNTGDNRLFASDEHRDTTTVRAVALDSLAWLRPPVDVIKIDVQGAEEAAVRGMAALLRYSPSVAASVEYWPPGMELFGSDPQATLAFYRSLGFEIAVQTTDGPGAHPLALGELPRTEPEHGDFVNLLLTRP
jgi:FkbM family methyltransferase